MRDAKMKNEKDVSYTIHEFSMAMQIWAYEIVPELSKRFDQQLHVHATLRPTKVERDLPYITSLVPFPDRPVQVLDDFSKSVVRPQFHKAAPASGENDGSAMGNDHDDESSVGVEDDETSASDDRQTLEGNGDDGSTADKSRGSSCDTSNETGAGDTEDDEDASGWLSGALPIPLSASSTSGRQGTRGGPIVTRMDVEGMLLDQHIFIEMRLRTVKLEIIQHVTNEFARLRDFISTLVPPSGGTSTSATAHIVNEPNIWDDPYEDPGEIIPTLPSDDNEEAPSTHDVT
ncbi:Hypothetical predicted protein [Olea europaea subsp. europaea]|uniref:Uncharacterized protein n=1 Tax=Olea europaea subsp. europaea TaxID=158383 RepID=A0A8S0QAH4_OLEEU|nr:Hypothetical predicted protein [Olea europaea subsp. europaea]